MDLRLEVLVGRGVLHDRKVDQEMLARPFEAVERLGNPGFRRMRNLVFPPDSGHALQGRFDGPERLVNSIVVHDDVEIEIGPRVDPPEGHGAALPERMDERERPQATVEGAEDNPAGDRSLRSSDPRPGRDRDGLKGTAAMFHSMRDNGWTTVT